MTLNSGSGGWGRVLVAVSVRGVSDFNNVKKGRAVMRVVGFCFGVVLGLGVDGVGDVDSCRCRCCPWWLL